MTVLLILHTAASSGVDELTNHMGVGGNMNNLVTQQKRGQTVNKGITHEKIRWNYMTYIDI